MIEIHYALKDACMVGVGDGGLISAKKDYMFSKI